MHNREAWSLATITKFSALPDTITKVTDKYEFLCVKFRIGTISQASGKSSGVKVLNG
jgi:hypothetical protein